MRAFRCPWSGITLIFLVALTQNTRGGPAFQVLHGFATRPEGPASALLEAADGSFYGTTEEKCCRLSTIGNWCLPSRAGFGRRIMNVGHLEFVHDFIFCNRSLQNVAIGLIGE